MCQWLMTAALSELLNKVEFTLNCTESKRVALRATLSAQRAKWHWTFGITFTSWFQKILVESSVAKASVTVSLTVGTCAFACVHMCAYTFMSFVFHWGLFLRVEFRAKFSSQRVWTQNVLVLFFVKSNFVAKCTCKTFALKWLSCRGRAARAGFSGVGEKSRKRFEVCRNCFLGFYNEKLSDLPATVAGK